MKKCIILLYVLCFATEVIFSSAFAAGVVGTPHDVRSLPSTSEGGFCFICHNPETKCCLTCRLREIPNRDFGTEGIVGTVCYSCHANNGFGSTIFIEASFDEKYVFPGVGQGALSHGQYVYGPYEESTIKAELPYVEENDYTDDSKGANTLQCTTCHNVHDNTTFRPFLRENIKDLCARCHKTDEAHTKGVKTDVIKDGEVKMLRLSWSEGSVALFNLLPFDDPDGATDGFIGDGKGRWNLGLHLATDTISDGVPGNGLEGEITCVTCHAVHGVQDDSSANTPIDIPRKGLVPVIK